MDKLDSIVIVGPPGVGKSTLLKNMAQEESDIGIVSFGEIFRGKAKTDQRLRDIYIRFSSEGKRLPDHVVIAMMEEILSRLPDHQKTIILESFPKTPDQLLFVQTDTNLLGVVELTSPNPELLLGRINLRSVFSGRIEDTPEIAPRRIADYYALMPLLEPHLPPGIVTRIDGSAPEQEVAQRFKDIVARLRSSRRDQLTAAP